jgi:predicted naringenin-chalcone synthase
MTQCYVHSIATAVPERCLSTADAPAVLEGTCVGRRGVKLLHRLAPLTGIEKRHLAILDFQSSLSDADGIYRPASEQPKGPGMTDRSAAFEIAAGRLLRQLLGRFPSGALSDVESLITVSCTHASSPGLEKTLFDHAALAPTAHRWNLGFMGCSAGLAAMRLVHRAEGGMGETLIVACELSSLHFQYSDALDQMTANLLFADGAAGIILSPRPSAVRVMDCRCIALPAFADQMVWRAGDHGLELQLAKDLPDTLRAHLPRAVTEFLHDNGLKPGQIPHWLVHPGGPQILDCVQACLGLAPDALAVSRAVLRQYGNMSSPTILFILQESLKTGLNGVAVALAFGPGLTIEMLLLDVA